MSELDSENGFSLVPHESRDLAVSPGAQSRILSEMIESSLVLARDSVIIPVDLDALVREGKRIFRVGEGMTEENIRAYKLFLQAAQAGHAEGQYRVARCYDWGRGGQLLDKVQALDWLRRSVEAGFAEAQHLLGFYYSSGAYVVKDYTEAVKWYRNAAEQGNAAAANSLGNCYQCGNGVVEDEEEAAKWYHRAAEHGDPSAQSSLGDSYLAGQGVSQDYGEAFKWFRKAAEQGNAWGQYNSALCYHNGIGVAIDILQAYKWYQLAADQDHYKSKNAKEEAIALAGLMSPSEFKTAHSLYQEFVDTHPEE